MAKVITTELQHSGASGANITLDSSKNVTCENNLQVDGNVTVTGTLPADKLTGNLPAISGASLTNLPSGGKGKNLFINGAMAVDQRREGASEDFASSYVWVVDRFFAQEEGTQNRITVQQVDVAADTDPWNAGFRKAGKITNGDQNDGPVAAAGVHLHYKFEAQDIAQSGWDYTSASSYVTFSFWIKSSVAMDIPYYFRSRDGSARMYSTSTGSLSANTWTKVTKTIPGDTGGLQIDNNNDRGLELLLAPYYGTNGTASGSTLNAWKAWSSSSRWEDVATTWWDEDDATLEFTGFKLEVGNSATDFDFKTYGDELLKCLRYFYKTSATGAAWKRFYHGRAHDSNTARFMMDAPVPFRTVPSATYSGNFQTDGGTYTSNPAVEALTSDNRQLCFTTGNSGSGWSQNDALAYMASDDTSASISFSAEL